MQFPFEVAAIQAIRTRNPNVGQKTLARKIVNRDFTEKSIDYSDSRKAYWRSFLSVYSVIRRFDAKAKAEPSMQLPGASPRSGSILSY